jgi:hypothetical protein
MNFSRTGVRKRLATAIRMQDLVVADIVLDASAVLAVIFEEVGSERVALHLPGAMISSVNVAEVMTKSA